MCVWHVPRGSVSVGRCTSAPYVFENYAELADEVAEFYNNRAGCEARCGNISEWDVSNVESMHELFLESAQCTDSSSYGDGCNFNGNIEGAHSERQKYHQPRRFHPPLALFCACWCRVGHLERHAFG